MPLYVAPLALGQDSGDLLCLSALACEDVANRLVEGCKDNGVSLCEIEIPVGASVDHEICT